MASILVIDDENQSFRVGLEEALDHHSLRYAADAASGLKDLDDGGADLVLLDIMLPDIDGRKVCSYLRESPELSGVKIIAISGYISEGGFQDLLEQGFDDFLVKPFANEDLIEKVGRLVEK